MSTITDPRTLPARTTPARPAPATAPTLTNAPFVPTPLLRQHAAFVGTDTPFARASRVLASLWRADEGLAMGHHVSRLANGRTRRIPAGWRLRPADARAGRAFLSEGIARVAHRALVLRESGSSWDQPKIYGHLLSSQNLCLNLFGPMLLDLGLGTAVWRQLMPDFVHHVTGIRFESSPGRDREDFLEDGTAHDAVIDIITPDGEPAFIAVEMKYIEPLSGGAASYRPRYKAAAHAVGLFVDPDAPALYRAGLDQLRRELCLAQLQVNHGLASRGRFVLVGPDLHPRLATVAASYASHLLDPIGLDPRRVGFAHLTVERILAALTEAGAGDHAAALHRRFLDLGRVATLALGEEPPEPPLTPAPTPVSSVLRLPAPPPPDPDHAQVAEGAMLPAPAANTPVPPPRRHKADAASSASTPSPSSARPARATRPPVRRRSGSAAAAPRSQAGTR